LEKLIALEHQYRHIARSSEKQKVEDTKQMRNLEVFTNAISCSH